MLDVGCFANAVKKQQGVLSCRGFEGKKVRRGVDAVLLYSVAGDYATAAGESLEFTFVGLIIDQVLSIIANLRLL